VKNPSWEGKKKGEKKFLVLECHRNPFGRIFKEGFNPTTSPQPGPWLKMNPHNNENN